MITRTGLTAYLELAYHVGANIHPSIHRFSLRVYGMIRHTCLGASRKRCVGSWFGWLIGFPLSTCVRTARLVTACTRACVQQRRASGGGTRYVD